VSGAHCYSAGRLCAFGGAIAFASAGTETHGIPVPDTSTCPGTFADSARD